MQCLFVSDLHGRVERYEKLFVLIGEERPAAVFFGGDLLPWGRWTDWDDVGGDFVEDFFIRRLRELGEKLGDSYPDVFVIMGNDDVRAEEGKFIAAAEEGVLKYMHKRRENLDAYTVYGYSHVHPSPFLLKDWERYDVSRYVDPGCISPEDGERTVEVPSQKIRYQTIAKDLDELAGEDDLEDAVLLFHSPPYQTKLDRAALDGWMIDHVPVDTHIGSIAVQRFIEKRQPLVTLHGHVHESARLTGAWMDRIGQTVCLSAAHDGPELAVVRFDLRAPDEATRELL